MRVGILRWMMHWGKLLAGRMTQDDMFAYAAALAYNFLFALFPFILFLSALLAFLHLSPHLHEVFKGPLSQLLPVSLVSFIATAWKQLVATRHPTLLSLGALGFLSGMSGAFRQLIEAMNHAYEFPLPRRRRLWKSYILSVLSGLAIGLIIALALLLASVSAQFLHSLVWLIFKLLVPAGVLIALRWIGLVILLWLTLIVLYAVLPDQPRPIRWLNPGALAAVAIWVLISLGFSFYIDRFNTYDRIYGSLGAIILLMLYLYFAGVALVVGAEITALTDADFNHTTPIKKR